MDWTPANRKKLSMKIFFIAPTMVDVTSHAMIEEKFLKEVNVNANSYFYFILSLLLLVTTASMSVVYILHLLCQFIFCNFVYPFSKFLYLYWNTGVNHWISAISSINLSENSAMFSIAAINDKESEGQWVPLAPTKEAQEFHLSQTYHDGLLQLEAKDYVKACELLETVLKDPLISSAHVDDNASDGHLLQLKFLVLKNLSTVFLQQSPAHYENALNCYLQAVEIDTNDSVVWNQLGTLSCSMGLLSISRWAFEQGLLCSPNNWNCMEKLLEVLISIGDEIACLSVANLILRQWPSHYRALHIKRTIEDEESLVFLPRGIDKLEPKHSRLIFSKKRKATQEKTDEDTSLKRMNQNIEICLPGLSWEALADGILSVLLPSRENDRLQKKQDHESITARTFPGHKAYKDTISHIDAKILILLPTRSDTLINDSECGKTSLLREKEGCIDEEHPQERRSTRLERLRSRKPGKDELDSVINKNLAKVVFQFLEPFILNQSKCKESKDIESDGSNQLSSDGLAYSAGQECDSVTKFINASSKNYGAYHLTHLLLEEIARTEPLYQSNFNKFLDLEKFTRQWPRDRTPVCSLFLSELYYDSATCASTESKRSELLLDASYHLCKVIELVTLDYEGVLSLGLNNTSGSMSSQQAYDPDKSTFWIRFFWTNACLSLLSGSTEKALKEFSICLSVLRNYSFLNGSGCNISLQHCKTVRWLNADRIIHQINLIKIDDLLKRSISKMIEKGLYTDCVNSLVPFLLCTEDVYPDLVSGLFLEKGDTAIELSALDVLLLACEKAEPMEIGTYLNTHRRKLKILVTASGMLDSKISDKYSEKIIDSDLETAETVHRHWNQKVADEVREISRCASLVKNVLDQKNYTSNISSILVYFVGDIQTLLLAVMCNFAKIVLAKKKSGSSSSLIQIDEIETQCLIDALIAFCKLQHLDPTVSIKSQVDLITAIHDLLAEYGLCCAGNDCEGKEGTFLKLAIKHLFALDVKLKSGLQLGNEKSETRQTDVKVAVGDDSKIIAGHLRPNSMEEPTHVKQVCGSLNSVQEDIPHKSPPVDQRMENDEVLESVKDNVEPSPNVRENLLSNVSNVCSQPLEIEREKVELGIDNALDQSFFCLYGLNIKSGQDSSSEDDLAIHKNTNRGDYQTKDQCADVFQYILPYAKVSSRTGIVKLRRVLRAIRKHFPRPSDDVLAENIIDKFLDSPDLLDGKLYEIIAMGGSHEALMNLLLFTNRKDETPKTSHLTKSGPYLEVYSNLYFLIAQVEEMSATDKFTGFVLNKGGAEFVKQNANLFKYDLLYNPLHFESWQKLANIYDEEVDLLLNDGSKHINIAEWGKNAALPQRVEKARRRSRRCLLMSLALAKTPIQQCQILELLGLVYYDSLQNVAPFYDQRGVSPKKDEAWLKNCQNSFKHFEEAYLLKPDWIHAFYLGKLCEKMGYSPERTFYYYNKAILLNPSSVESFYRMHSSRLKFLYNGKWDADSLKIIALYSFKQSAKEAVCGILKCTDQDLHQTQADQKDDDAVNVFTRRKTPIIESHHLDEAWNFLYNDCLSALELCTEGELKHYHKSRYMIAQGFYKRNKTGDLERAKSELSFCFRSSRSSFTINMWEIDGAVKKGKRKTVLEVSLPESSRKFISCIRKYLFLYLELLDKAKDLCTLERAYTYLRTDRRFNSCLGDIVPVALGRYAKALTLSICSAENALPNVPPIASNSLKHLLEKMFHLLMDHATLWVDIGNLPEVKCPELSETHLYGFVHQYIYMLENDSRLDNLEGINEKIRKRFKNPKLASPNLAKMCKHAAIAWCRCILAMLASITPVNHITKGIPSRCANSSDNGLILFVDIQPDELANLPPESIYHPKDREMKWTHSLLNMRKVCIEKAFEQNIEKAHILLRNAYNFYKESSCGIFPSGINLYTVLFSSQFTIEEPWQPGKNGVEVLDISIPRKLLLWAHTLVYGQYSNILVVVKHCEEIAKSKLKKGVIPLASSSSHTTMALPHTGCVKDRVVLEDRVVVDESSPAVQCITSSIVSEIPRAISISLQPQICGKDPEITQTGGQSK